MAGGSTRARSFPLVPLVLGLIGVLGVVAVMASRGSDEDGETAAGVDQTRPVVIEGDRLPALGEGDDPALGMRIPEVRGASFDGSPVSIAPGQRPKVLMFLAHWCPHCQAEVPVINGWLDESGPPEGVELISVSTSVNESRPNYPPSSWLEEEDWEVPVLADDADSSVAQAFGLSAFPFFVAVDADGKVVGRTSGELPIAELEALVSRARD